MELKAPGLMVYSTESLFLGTCVSQAYVGVGAGPPTKVTGF